MAEALTDAERSMLLEQLAKAPRALGPGAPGSARSPSCGDEVTVAVRRDAFIIQELSWHGHGCTVSMAAAAALAAVISQDAPLNIPELRKLFARYEAAVRDPVASVGDVTALELPGDLDLFAGIGRFPLRARCATLAWHALDNALDNALEGALSESNQSDSN